MPRRAKTERKHQKINQTQKKTTLCMFLFSPLLFQPCSIGLCRFFLSDILGFCMFAKKCKKHGGNKKKQYQPYVPMGPVVLFCLFFVFSTFFFLFFCTVAKKNQIQRKYQKTKLSKTPMGLIFFCGLVRVRNF